MVRSVLVGVWLTLMSVGLAFGQEPEPSSSLPEEVKALQERVRELEERLDDVVVTAPRAPSRDDGARGTVVTALDRIELDASLSVAFGYNLAKPEVRVGANRTHVMDPDHNTVGLPYARIGIGKSLSGLDEIDVGFRVDVAAGRMVKEAYSDDGLFGGSSSFGGNAINVPQAYVELQMPVGFGLAYLKAGRQESYFGVEHYDPTKNVNFSLSHLAAYMPKSLTGASIGLELAPGVRYTQWVGNGWNRVVDDNDAKSTGGQLALRLDGIGANLAFNWILGAERPDCQDKRWMIETAFDWQLAQSTLIKASLMYGQEAGGALDGSTAKFGGFVVVAKQGFFSAGTYDRFSLGVRGSYLRDEGGALTGEEQTLAEVTGTIEYRPLENLALRAEYRHDWSSETVFLGGSGSSPSADEQDTIALELSIQF